MNPEFWKDKKVFLTGHTGFKGSWLSLWLKSLGADLTGYSLPPPTKPSFFELAQVGDGVTSLLKDIRDFKTFSTALKDRQPEIVIHMAAQPLVRYSYENPVETYETNVMGTVHLLEAARQCSGIKAILVVTSDKCYENRAWHWGYRENEAMGGSDPYSSSKGCTELVAQAMQKSFFSNDTYDQHGVAVATARAGNAIGGGDWSEDRLVPDIISGILEGKEIDIRNPQAIRPWQHALEPLGGYMMLVEKLVEEGPAYAEAWNFGPENADCQPVSYLAEKIIRLWGDSARWKQDMNQHPHEAAFLKLDCSKAKARLHWKPAWNVDRALEETVSWYRECQNRPENLRAFSLQQISSYMKDFSSQS